MTPRAATASAPDPAPSGIVADVTATARNLSGQTSSVRWFSAVAMLAIVLTFAYFIARDVVARPEAPTGSLTEDAFARRFAEELAKRDARVRPSTDPELQALRSSVEALTRAVDTLRQEGRADLAALRADVTAQVTRVDRVLELVARPR